MARLDLLRVMTLVRECLYLGGPAPARSKAGPWSERCDWNIAKRLVAKYGEAEVFKAIHGLALLRDSDKLTWAKPQTKMTLRALTTAKFGDHSMFHQARIAWVQHEKQQPIVLPTRLKQILREVGA